MRAGYENRIGIVIDVGADHFYDVRRRCYHGLFAERTFSYQELVEKLLEFQREYPILLIQDPLQADDFEGYEELTRESSAMIVGNEIFGGKIDRFSEGIKKRICDGITISPALIGTVTDACNFAAYAAEQKMYISTYGTRGEDVDIGDYAVGLGSSILLGSGLNFVCNRILEIERELGTAATFAGPSILQIANKT